MREYLTDSKFLSMLDEMRIKKHYAKITVLSFVDEKPLREIQGIATAGSVTVNGQAALRRTISLTVSGIENENDINNIENIISINKKVKIEVGLENPFEDYKDYGDIIWFPLGTYVINQATTSTTASSANISISGKDKMCMLDGTCGGTLPSAVTFHETQHEDDNGDIFIEQVPIFTIIKECVTHFGKEPEQNVIINDVDMTAKLSTKYVGQNPIWFSKDYKSFVISENAPEDENFLQHKFIYGQDVGYQETDFTYPGELVFSAGDTVTSVLDKIIESLGNYEYFYDLDGHFIFQQKKNYLNYYYTPITQINDNYYIKAFSDSKYYYTFIDAKDALSYYNSPKYENIKNDFIVWGDKTNANGVTKTIQYHLAIDEKPIPGNEYKEIVFTTNEDTDLREAKKPIVITEVENYQGYEGYIYKCKDTYYKCIDGKLKALESGEYNVQSVTTSDWRDELYLQGIQAEGSGLNTNAYYVELINEWPKLYDTEKGAFHEDLINSSGGLVGDLDYFLDFIDSSSAIGEFSVKNIGRRTKVVNNDKINCIFEANIPDVILINLGDSDTVQKKKDEANARGQKYLQVSGQVYDNLAIGGSQNSAYNEIKNLLYEYTSYNESIQLQAIPIYHLEPNTRIIVNDVESDIHGDYIIKSISLPLDINGTMSITATRAIDKL